MQVEGHVSDLSREQLAIEALQRWRNGQASISEIIL